MHALTDVTGFGLLGHALEMARGSGARDRRSRTARCRSSRRRAALAGRVRHRRVGAQLGELRRRRSTLPAGLPDWRRHLLTDPQTSGGLLVACALKAAEAVLRSIRDAGYPSATIVGRVEAGAPRVRVEG